MDVDRVVAPAIPPDAGSGAGSVAEPDAGPRRGLGAPWPPSTPGFTPPAGAPRPATSRAERALDAARSRRVLLLGAVALIAIIVGLILGSGIAWPGFSSVPT